MSSAGHTRALQVAGAHHIAASASARPEAAEVPRRRPSERRKAPLPQGNFDPVFLLDFDPPLWYQGGPFCTLFFAPQPGAQQRSDGQPRPQRNPHTPGATHACACAAPYRALYSRVPPTANTEKVTHACAPRSEALTHARLPSASQLPAARASPRASAAAPSWLRSAPQPLPSPLSLPALARPRRVRLRPRRCT